MPRGSRVFGNDTSIILPVQMINVYHIACPNDSRENSHAGKDGGGKHEDGGRKRRRSCCSLFLAR